MEQVRHLIGPEDLNQKEMEELFRLADSILMHPERYMDVCKGKIMASLFFEPSTRTRLSFEAAMLRLGGQVMGFSEPHGSSASKGESLQDTIRTVACYADLAILRHPKEGAAKLAKEASPWMPVVNAGDGGHLHPTQTLTDLMTIRHLKKSLKDMTVVLCGDLMFGRTIHSLAKALSTYEGMKLILVSPKELKMPSYVIEELPPGSYVEVASLEEALPLADVLYMTRVQKERFLNEKEYERLKDVYVLTKEKLQWAKKELIIMHPLPRLQEISVAVDEDPRAAYFQQAKLGMYIRMALILKLLKMEDER